MSNVHYLEIVTNELDATCALYQSLRELNFGEAVAEMGHARIAKVADGSLIGIRKPLAEHDAPIVRSYIEVSDIEAAAKAAESQGAVIAYAPTKQGEYGTFCILIQNGLQHGLWQA